LPIVLALSDGKLALWGQQDKMDGFQQVVVTAPILDSCVKLAREVAMEGFLRETCSSEDVPEL
jgi:hypothetical protein